MNVKKAVITAAGRGQRSLPTQVFVDRDGAQKSALQIIVEEALSAGIEEICVVVCPGDQDAYAEAAGEHAGKLAFVEQAEPRGYGHALYHGRDFVAGEPFLHLVSDHLYISGGDVSCAKQLVDVAASESCAVSGVQPSRESMLPFYGVVGGHRLAGSEDLYAVEHIVEKPTPTVAEQGLLVPGLRAGHYLCMFGMHVLTPRVMDLLGEAVAAAGEDANVQLSPCLDRLVGLERYLALEVKGRRHNIGLKYGLLVSQMALALSGKDREDVLAELLALLASRERAV